MTKAFIINNKVSGINFILAIQVPMGKPFDRRAGHQLRMLGFAYDTYTHSYEKKYRNIEYAKKRFLEDVEEVKRIFKKQIEFKITSIV